MAFEPAGAQIYQSTVTGTTFAADSDSYAIPLESGQKVSVLFSPPASGWSGTITFAGPGGILYDSGAISLSTGASWAVEDLGITTSGDYSFNLQTTESGSENYGVSLLLNAGLENEAHSGAANNSIATAESLEPTSSSIPGVAGSRLAVQGSLDGTADYYSFAASAGQAVDVVLASSAIDSKVELVDSLNRTIASGIHNSNDGAVSIRGYAPTAGSTVYVRVTGTATTDYTLVVTRSIAFEVEPNDGLAAAQEIDGRTGVMGAITGAPLITTETEPNDNGIAGGQVTDLAFANDLSGSFLPVGNNQYRAVVTGVVSAGSDNGWDFFKILAGPGDTLVIDLEGSDTSAGSLSDPYVHLYNSTGSRLTFDDDAGAGLNSRLTYNFASLGEYYIAADSYSSETGSYRLTATLTTQNPRVGVGSDDYYSVFLSSGSVLEVRSATPGAATGNSLDPTLEVYAPSGSLVASDTNGTGDGKNALISYTAANSGRYIIKVSGGGTRGDYVLSVAGGAVSSEPLQVASISPSDGALLNTLPSLIEVSFSQPLLLTSVSAGDLTVNGVPAASVEMIDGDTLRFDVSNSVTTDGVHTVVIGAGAIQSLSGASSEFFLSTFDADATGPVVVASSIADGAVVAPGAFTYQVTLSEPINPQNIGVEDLLLTPLSGGSSVNPTSLLLSGSGAVITATFSDAVEGDYRLTLFSGVGSVRDLRGNLLDGAPSWPLPSGGGAVGDNFVFNFSVDATSAAFPTPVDVTRPIGGLVYEKTLSARVGNASDTDRYTLNVDAGQVVTVALLPGATLNGTVELRNSAGLVIATASSSSVGEAALIQSAVAGVADEYSITVRSTDSTTGDYDLRVVLNAGIELESVSDAGNNSIALAESLAESALSVTGGVSRMAVLGRSNGEDDYFSFTADAGQTLTVTAAPIEGGVQSLELFNSAGVRIAVGLLDGEGVSQNIRSLVAPASGDYYVRIRGLGATEYGLAVLVGSDIDVESNDDLGTPQLLDGPTIVLGGLQVSGGEVAIDFSDSVENLSLEGFATTGLWHVTDQWSGPAEGHSGPSIAYFGSDATGNFNLGTVSGTLTSPPVALRGGTSPTLSFSYRLEGETSTSWDRAFVRVSTNGGLSWDTVASKATILSQSLTWRRVNVDLSSYAGQTVLLQYLFESGDGISNNFLGWQIDDVSVTGVEDVQDHYAFHANDGDQLVITAMTPGDSVGEPFNALDAKIELFNEAGLLIATDDNSASDGRNPRLEFTVPAGQGGRLTARLSSSNSGSYALSLSGTSASNTHAPTVASVLPQNGQQLAAAPTSLLVTFSEAIRVDSVSASDLVFTDATVSVTGVEFVDGRNVRFSLNVPNADGIYDYSIDASAVLDLQGLGNAGFSGSFNVDRDGPVVVSTSPSTQASAPFSQISFFFDEAIDPASVSVADVIAFAGPSGNLLSTVTGVAVVINELIVRFQGQVTPGIYTMQIGPNLIDLVGNLMNQDQDNVNGETSDDLYSVTLNLQSPDLAVQSAQTVSSALFGQTINVEYEVRNIGDDPALEGWFDAVYLSTDAVLDRNDLRLAAVPTSGTFGPLDAAGGATDRYARTATVTLPLNDSVVGGNYFLIVATDDGARQPEANEGNNARATAVVSIATPPSVDLRVTNIVAPVEALSGQTIPIQWTITNNGAADFTGTFRDQVYLSADAAVGGDQFFGNFDFTGVIPAGGSITRIQQITLPLTLADDRYVIIRTDASNAVFELGGENNNTLIDDAIIDVRLSPFPNLQVTDVIAPPSAFSDQSVVVEWIVTNNGNGPTNAPTWTDRVYLSTDQVYDASDTFLGSVNNPAFLAAGDSYRSSLTATLPRGIDDNYYFVVRTDVFNNVNELNNENDNTGVSDVTDVQLTPPPDLRVTAVQAPASSFSGQTVSFNWTVANEGPGGTRAGAWSDRVYFSADNVLDAADTLLTTVGHSGALGPGASYNASGTGTLPIGVSGDFFFIVQTDAFNNVFEHVFEGNNTGFDSTPTSVSLTPPPDLEVEIVDAPTAATSSRSLTVNYRVTNFGATETPNANWNDRLFLSADNVFDAATDLQIATRTHFGALEPGESYDESFTTTLSNTITGSYFVFVVTDFGNAVFELNNQNNIGFDSTPLAITSQPANLSAASFTGPPAAEAGDSFLLSWVVQNIGVGDTAVASWFDRVVLSSDIVPSGDDLVLASVNHSDLLNPGGNYAVNDHLVQVPFTIAPGSYFLLLTTDAGNNVFEAAGEGNNVASPRPIVISRDESDLRVASVTASGSAQSGGSLTVNWTVRNDSPVATNANFWFDEIYLSTNNVIDDGDTLLGAVQRSNPLAPQGQYSVSRDFTLPQNVTGQFFVIVRTDSSNLVVEGPFENNNDRAASGNVEVGLSLVPDLAVTNVNAPTDGFGGQPFPLSWTVNNVGQEATNGSWYDSVYLSLDQVFDRATDAYLGFANRPNNLAVGASYTQTQSFNIPAGFAGQYYVFVVADGNDRVFERGSELNNTRLDPVSMHVTLTPPADFVVGSITIPANGVPGQTANFSYTVVNQGVNAAVGSWVDSIYLSADDVWDVNDPLVHRSTRSGPVAGGRSYTESFTAPLPGVIPGEYHVIIRSDILNRIPESNEGNNIGVSLNQAALDFQDLELGVAASGELAEGRTAYYKVTVPAGETLSFLLNSSLSSGANEVYVAFERVPTRSNYDYAAIEPFEVDQRALVPSTQAGTYFVAVYANDVISAIETQFYELTAELLDFDVFDTSYGRGGNVGDLTIEINGAKFDRSVTARIVDSSGVSRTARQMWYVDEVVAYATFDLRGLTPGNYDVVISNGEGANVEVPDGLQVVSSAITSLIPRIDAPSTVRRGSGYAFTVSWGNDGLNDVPAPLLLVGNSVGFGLTPGSDVLGTRYLLVGASSTGGPAGILRPGQGGTETFFSYSDTSPGTHSVFVDRIVKDPQANFDWSLVRDAMRPLGLSDPNFQAIYSQVLTQVGPTGGDFLEMLSRNASLLPPELGSPRNLRDLLHLEVDFALAAISTSIRGIATTAESGIQISGTAITAHNIDTDEEFAAVVLNDGSFVISQITPGRYEFTSENALVQAVSPMVVEANDHVQDVEVLLQQGAVIAGVVTSVSGTPIAGASLTIRMIGGSSLPSLVISDAAGKFTLAILRPGQYTIEARATGHIARLVTPVVVEVGQPALSDIVLTASGQQVVDIRDGVTGLPVSNVLISLSSSNGLPDGLPIGGLTDNAGRVILDGFVPGLYTLIISKAGYPRQTRVATLGGGPLAIALDQGVDAAGRLVDGSGAPLSGISVSLSSPSGELLTETTSGAGGFRFDGIAPGNYTLSVLSSGVAVYQQAIVIESEPAGQLTITVPVAGRINGQAQTFAGSPLDSGTVILTDGDGNTIMASPLTFGGYFDLLLLTPGQYGVAIRSAEGMSAVTLVDIPAVGSPSFDLTLPLGSSSVGGRLVDELGQAVVGATVFLSHSTGAFAEPVETDANGNFTFPGVPAGTVRVTATSSLRTWTSDATVVNEPVLMGNLTYQALAPINVVVTNSIGAPVIGALVILERNGVAADSTIIGDDGTATLLGKAGETYRLRVVTSSHTVSISEGVETGDDVAVQLSQTATVADGQVVYGAENSPIGDATVFAYDSNGDLVGVAYTDQEGVFTFRSLPAAAISLRVNAPGFLLSDPVVINLTATPVVTGASLTSKPAVVVTAFQPLVLAALSIEDIGLSENAIIGWLLNARNDLNLPVITIPTAECEEQLAAVVQINSAYKEYIEAATKLSNKHALYKSLVANGLSMVALKGIELGISLIPLSGIFASSLAKLGVIFGPAAADLVKIVYDEISGLCFGLLDEISKAGDGEKSLDDIVQSLSGISGSTILLLKKIDDLNDKLQQVKIPPSAVTGELEGARLLGTILARLSQALAVLSAVDEVLPIFKEIQRANGVVLSTGRAFEVAYEKVESLIESFEDIDCDDDDEEPDDPPDDDEEVERPASVDPNDILGPNGFGPERWTTASQPLNYTIRFENDPIFATAPAQVVRITQTLDSDLDFRTFRIGDFAIGTHFVDVPDNRAFYQERLNLTEELGILVDVFAGIDVTTGEAFWEFTSIDPATGEQPVDALAGFLPPNLTSPEGEGFVNYSVRPRSTATTGTVIDAEARIIFDVNEPIDTPPIFNTLDAGLPTSVVAALPTAAEASTFLVAWSGMDAEGGSGLAGYDIYVSENDGPYQIFLTNTTLTSAEFVGQPNRRYAFYSVARDNAGNAEAAPATPDALTMTPAPIDATPPAVTSATIQNGLTQRSFVDRLAFHFSEQVNLAALIGNGTITSAITLTNLGVNAPTDADQQIALTPAQFQYEYDEAAGVSRLTWSLDQFAGTNASLPDGLYEFVIDASLVTDLAGNRFDGNSNGTAGDNFVLTFHRLSGDANGDRTVNAADMTLVNSALGSRPGVAAWNANADLDRDGVVTTRDRLIVSRGTGNAVIAPAPGNGLAGDYNQDGAVDAADYTAWRDNYGATSPAPLAADGDGNGAVDGHDFLVWQRNYGNTTPPVEAAAPTAALAATVEVVLAYAPAAIEIIAVPDDSPQPHSRSDLIGLALAAEQLSTSGFRSMGRASFRSEPLAQFLPSAVSDWDVVDLDEASWRVAKTDALGGRFDDLFARREERDSSAEFDAAFAELFVEADFDSDQFATSVENSSRFRGRLTKVK